MRAVLLAVVAAAAVAACARADAGARIVNGYAVVDNSALKFLAVLRFASNGAYFCTGSLIAPRYVLTAAHCVSGRAASSLHVTVGCRTLSASGCADAGEGAPAVTLAVTHVMAHPLYGGVSTLANDIAVLRLASDVPSIAPVALATTAERSLTCACTSAVVAGWGVTSSTTMTAPTTLRYADTPVVGDDNCAAVYSGAGYVVMAQQNVCAGSASQCTDSCYGDSGGPLVARVDASASSAHAGEFVQIGVVSYGIDCGTPTYPGVYTRVARYSTALGAVVASGGSATALSTTVDSGVLPTSSECDARPLQGGASELSCPMYPGGACARSNGGAHVRAPAALAFLATAVASTALAVT